MARLAVDGGTPVRRAGGWPHWPPSSQENWPEFEAEMRQVFLSRTEGLPQPRGKRFAAAYCEFLGVKHGLFTVNGTNALKLGLGAITDTDGLGENGECIVPNYTFIASATAALEMGFSVRFVDVDVETGCLDSAALEAAITPRTRAIMPVHILGCPADMDAIMAIADRHNLKVIEDACQAQAAAYKGRRCGGLGHAGAFSFQSSKNLTSGEGGFLSTNDEEVWKIAHALHHVGQPPAGTAFSEPRVGHNYRGSEYLAALLETRLRVFQQETDRRIRAVEYLSRELQGISGLRPAHVPDYVTTHGYHLFLLKYIPSGFGGRPRSEFIRAMAGENIPCSAGYGDRLSRHPGIAAVRKRHPELIAEEPCPNTERLCAESVWIGQTILLADEQDLAPIPEAVRKIQKAWHT